MCNSSHSPPDGFAGSFNGKNSGFTSVADLTVKNNRLSGTLVINGKSSRVSGIVKGMSTTGTIYDQEVGSEYSYSGSIYGDELRLSIVFPELENRTVEFILQRQTSNDSYSPKRSNTTSSKERDEALIGVWKNTEVLGGGGADGMSFSTEYFMEFREYGTLMSWTGRSAGSDLSVDSDEANASKAEWYTEGNTLYFIDPATRKDASTYYSVDENRMMLHNGGSDKKIFERVR